MKLIIFLALISLIFCSSWLPSVTGYSEYDSNNGYAGIIGKPIVGIQLNCGVQFRIHYVGKSSWEAATTGKVGDLKNKIDGIAIKGKTYKVYANGRWLPAVSGYNINDDDNGYAGILGYEISGLMVNGCTYAVAITDGPIDPVDVNPPINTKGQKFVSTGTGVEGITYQYKVDNMAEGCFFMGCCVIGGLGNDAQIQLAYHWALNNGYINSKAWVTGCDGITLAKKISQHFGTTFHSGWALRDVNCNHYWVVDNNNREVFNAAGLYYKGRGC